MARQRVSYAGPERFAHLALACPACLGPAGFRGGSSARCYFVCTGCGLDFDLRASDVEHDHNADAHD